MTDRKELDIGGTVVSVDLKKSAELNANNSFYNWCQCDGCTNSRFARYRFAPSEQHQLIEDLGLDPMEPFADAGFRWRRENRKPGWHRIVSTWLVCGKVVREQPTQRRPKGREHSWDIQAAMPEIDYLERRISEADLNLNGPLLYLVARNTIPYLFDEVCEFRSVQQTGPCVSCAKGSSWVDTGYLKRGSRIPDWYGLPELQRSAGKKRILIAVCLYCGHLSWRIVEGSPYRGAKSPDQDIHDSWGSPRVHLDESNGWSHEPWRAEGQVGENAGSIQRMIQTHRQK